MSLHARWMALAMLAALLGASAAAPGATFKLPDGFSLVYPDGWSSTMSAADPGNRNNRIPCAEGSMTCKTPGEEGLAAHIDVLVARDPTVISAAALSEYKTKGPKEAKAQGVTVTRIEAQIVDLAGRKAISAELTCRANAGGPEVRQKQVLLTGDGKLYIVTCTAARADFARHEAAFRRAIESIHVRGAPNTGGLGWLGGGVARGALLGGMGGLIAGVCGWIWKRNANKKALPYAMPAGPSPIPPVAGPPLPMRATAPPPSAVSALEALTGAAGGPPDLPARSPAPAAAPVADEFVRVLCTCGQRVKAPTRYSGRRVQCPKCQAILIVP